MAEGPFVFVATYKVRDGKLADYKQNLTELVRLVEKDEPQLISFNASSTRKAGARRSCRCIPTRRRWNST